MGGRRANHFGATEPRGVGERVIKATEDGLSKTEGRHLLFFPSSSLQFQMWEHQYAFVYLSLLPRCAAENEAVTPRPHSLCKC